SDGQLTLPLVVRCANGAGLRFGAQHSQSVENWAMAVPGLKVVAPSNPRDVIGLLAAAVRDPDPVIFFEHKGLYPSKGEVPDGEITDELGRASVLRQGGDATIVALAAMVPRAMAAAAKLSAEDGIEATVVDVRSLVPLDTQTILAEVARTGRLFTVEENPRLCGWGAEIVSIVAEGTVEDALDAVGAAAGALAGWAATPPRQRAEFLRRTFELMTEHAESLARLMVAENGKALRDARAEATYSAEFFRWYAEEAVRMEGVLMTAPSGANKILVMRQPVGVSVLVTPWNFPAAMATRKIGPALAAGCTVVLKPAKETPLSAFAVAEILREAGVPDGVVNVLTTQKAGPLVSAMLADPRVR